MILHNHCIDMETLITGFNLVFYCVGLSVLHTHWTWQSYGNQLTSNWYFHEILSFNLQVAIIAAGLDTKRKDKKIDVG